MRRLMVAALLCFWLLAQGLAAAHSHESVQLHGDCAMCHVAQAESLPGDSFPQSTAWCARDVDAPAPLLAQAVVPFTRHFRARAPPHFS
ncbi:MAG: hypothetical protein AB8G16_10910 [Gammaproteobacteria bacterium]